MHDKQTNTSYITCAGSRELIQGRSAPAFTTTPLSVPTLLTTTSVLKVSLLLAIVIWFAHFFQSSHFGLYEDDWYRIPKAMGISNHDLWTLIRATFSPSQSQGRPLHPALIYMFSALGYRLGGLPGIYFLSYLILVANTLLFYCFVRRGFFSDRLALLSALAFSLYPADTTQPFLTHGLGVQPSMTFLLVAFLLFLSDRKAASYLVITLCLFTYETPFLVFSVAPLLRRRSWRSLLRHCALLGVMLLAVFAARAFTAETRASNLGIHDLLLGLLNIVIGPLTTLAMFLYRPVEALFKMANQSVLLLLAFFVALALVFSWGFRGVLWCWYSQGSSRHASPRGPGIGRWPLVIGSIMLLAAYPLTLTTTGVAVAGRGTRVHTAAALGASIIFGYAVSIILSRISQTTFQYLPPVSLALYFSLLIGFGFVVQCDYVRGWSEQRAFWSDLIRLCPDLDDGDVIFVEPTGLLDTRQLSFLRKDLTGVPETRQIKSLDVLFDVLPEVYHFPESWKTVPRVFRLPIRWRDQLFTANDRMRLLTIESGYSFFPSTDSTVASSKAIFLDTSGGVLTRRTSLIDIRSGRQVTLKKLGVPVRRLRRSEVFQLLIMDADERPMKYLVR